ncbi:MAG: universal stress protein [Betaproteobacteria bacterium]|nr:universal stress protein [Betaproteobacteria bacterium]
MKRILVHLDASPRTTVRLALAQRLAHRDGAELDAFYGVEPTLVALPWAAAEGLGSVAAALAELDTEQRKRARTLVDQAAGRSPLSWIDGGAAPYWSLLQHAMYTDLLVLGQTDDQDGLTGPLTPGLVPHTIIDTGKPTLVVPANGSFEIPGRILVGWKPTRESARAVTAALPWLRRATAVHLTTRVEEEHADAPARLTHWLQLHDVVAPIEHHRLADGEVGAALLSLAAASGAELLVMGCYGHSRARELVLGGASRTVLRSMTLPVLMVH